MRRFAPFVMVVLVAMLASGCVRADFQLLVRNDSPTAWLIRTASGDPDLDVDYVRLVQPFTEGLALSWLGPRDHPIELLNADCSLAGVFEPSGDSLIVPGVDGVVAIIQPYQDNDRWNVPGIEPTSLCGGTVSM